MADFLEVSELYHHGIKGQKWGYRRYQNEDGTLTEAGKKRYGAVDTKTGKFLNPDGEKQFRIDQRAIKGQKNYEKGKSLGDLRRSKLLANTVLISIGGLSAYAAFKGTSLTRTISKGEYRCRQALLGIGALSLTAASLNNIIAGNQIKNAMAYKAVGPKQYQRIKPSKDK